MALQSSNAAVAHKVEVLLHQLYGKKGERRTDEHPELPFPADEQTEPPHRTSTRARSANCVSVSRCQCSYPRKNRRPRQRHSWAELLRRVYLIDVLTCPSCQGRRTLLAAIHDPDSIRRILHHLGLPAEPPAVTPARPPPQARLPW